MNVWCVPGRRHRQERALCPGAGRRGQGDVLSMLSYTSRTLGISYHMEAIQSSQPDARRRRQRLTAAIKQALRELNNQLSLLNHRVGARLDLNDVDLDCLDFLSQHGPLS